MIHRQATSPRSRYLSAAALGSLFCVLLAACGPSGPGVQQDSRNPSVYISSSATSTTAAYTLTGGAVDNVAVVSAEYALGDGEPQPLTMSGAEFSVAITLAPGPNEIVVRARDAAGNAGEASRTVTFAEGGAGVPALTSLSAEVVPWGGSLTLSGSNFGSGGTVTVGGAEASTSTWSSTQIILTVPAAAGAGPAEVTVTTADGSGSAEVFVGVEFAPGPLDALAAAGHPRGTAVLLGAGTYTTTASELVLDNLSLYGRGQGVTTINTGNTPKQLIIYADLGHDIVLSDLTLRTDDTVFRPNPEAIVWQAMSSNVGQAGEAQPGNLLELAGALATALPDAGQFSAQNSLHQGSVTLADLQVLGNVGGRGLFVTDLVVFGDFAGFYSGDVRVDGVTFDGLGISFLVLTSGDVTVRDSVVSAAAYAFIGIAGKVDFRNNVMSSGTLTPLINGAGIIGAKGLEVVDSQLASNGGALVLGLLPVSYGGGDQVPFPTQVLISGNTLHAVEPNPAALPPDESGLLQIALGATSALVTNNTLVAQRAALVEFIGAVRFLDNTFELGRSGIAATTLQMGLALYLGPEDSHLELLDNEFAWQNQGGLRIDGAHRLTMTGNELVAAGGAPAGTALTLRRSYVFAETNTIPWDIAITDNAFRNFANALSLTATAEATGPANMAMNNNHFDFPFAAAPQVAELTGIQMAHFNINADYNAWGPTAGPFLSAPTANTYITNGAGTDAGVMTIDFTLPGPP